MIYRSNITAPDLQPYFKHVVSRAMPHSFGHDVLSDWADKSDDDPVFGIYKRCGFWTHDEAAILYRIALHFRGEWADIGAHTGWTSRHLAEASCHVHSVDNMLAVEEFRSRFTENVQSNSFEIHDVKSSEFFSRTPLIFNGVVIDGDHEHPLPLEDAQASLSHLKERGVILLHDATGGPVQKAVRWLISQGLRHKIYYTPHVVVCCWKGDFEPPEHVPDPVVSYKVKGYLRI